MKSNQHRIRWLKEAGELFFSNACNDSGMVATKPGQDMNGWDFFVELPQNRIPKISLDGQPAPIKFVCQVKASDNLSNQKRSITVSNMEHLCRSMLPAFILMVDFSGGHQPTSVYFCHINKDRIGQTLKKIRELQKGKKIDLHRHSLSFSTCDDEKIDLSDIRWVAETIKRDVGIDAAKYLENKSNIIKMIGFEDDAKIAKFSTSLTLSETVDAFLGLRDLDVTDFGIFSNRFGIELPEEFAATAKLSIKSPSIGHCYAIASSKTSKKRIKFPVNVKIPNLPELNPQNFKTLVEWPFTRLIITDSEVDVKINIENTQAHKLSSLSNVMCVFDILSFPDAKVEFFAQNGRFAVLNINDCIDANPTFSDLASQLKILRLFLDAAGYRDDIEMSLENLYNQTKDIRWMEILLEKKLVKLSAKRENKGTALYPPGPGKFARPIGFDFLDQTFIAWCEWDANIAIESNSVTAEVESGSVWGNTFILPTQRDHALALSIDFKKYCEINIDGYLIFQDTIIDNQVDHADQSMLE